MESFFVILNFFKFIETSCDLTYDLYYIKFHFLSLKRKLSLLL